MSGGGPIVTVMGVAGAGKSFVGVRLAEHLGCEFKDADDLHSAANVAKMTSGQPLTDEDRWPWLHAAGAWLQEHKDARGVIACSALRRVYRDVLREEAPRVVFLHLAGVSDIAAAHMAERHDHFMPTTLLASQYQTLEPLQYDEAGIVVDMGKTPEEIIAAFVSYLDEKGEQK